jgi:hypothetical protein
MNKGENVNLCTLLCYPNLPRIMCVGYTIQYMQTECALKILLASFLSDLALVVPLSLGWGRPSILDWAGVVPFRLD